MLPTATEGPPTPTQLRRPMPTKEGVPLLTMKCFLSVRAAALLAMRTHRHLPLWLLPPPPLFLFHLTLRGRHRSRRLNAFRQSAGLPQRRRDRSKCGRMRRPQRSNWASDSQQKTSAAARTPLLRPPPLPFRLALGRIPPPHLPRRTQRTRCPLQGAPDAPPRQLRLSARPLLQQLLLWVK